MDMVGSGVSALLVLAMLARRPAVPCVGSTSGPPVTMAPMVFGTSSASAT